MTRFVFQGSGHTTGPDMKGMGTAAAAVVIAVLAYEGLGPAARAAGDVAVIVTVAVAALALGAVVTLLAVRLRGRRRAAGPVRLWHPNPHGIPPAPRRAINPAPQVVVNIDAGLLAGLLAAQQQPAPVIIQPEHEELPR